MATVWARGTPAAAAKRSSAAAFPGRSDEPAGDPAVDDLQGVGRGVVEAQLGGERVGHLGEAAGDDPDLVVETLQGADERPGAGGEHHGAADLVEGVGGQAGQ
jgi:hypothetical protein